MPPKHIYNVKITRLTHHEIKGKLLKLTIMEPLPAMIDLRPKMPPVYDQGSLGSCTSNALVAAFEYDVPNFMGSRLFVYYNERKLECNIPDDEGAQLSDGVKSLEKYGVCPETEWPYIIPKFAMCPPQSCYISALKHLVTIAHNISNDIYHMKSALSSGYPFVVGIVVYQSFESESVATTGIVPMPQGTDLCLGGHAVLVCGYDDTKQHWIVRNSWGDTWGDKGYFYLPYQYLVDSSLSSDLWNITSVNVIPTPPPPIKPTPPVKPIPPPKPISNVVITTPKTKKETNPPMEEKTTSKVEQAKLKIEQPKLVPKPTETKPTPKPLPNPNEEKLAPKPKESKPAPQPTPKLKESKPTPNPAPKPKESSPVPKPTPNSAPKPNETKPAPKLVPKSKETKPSPKLVPKPTETKPAPKLVPKPNETKQVPKPKETKPAPKIVHKPNEIKPAPKLVPKPNEAKPTSKIVPNPKETTPAPKPKETKLNEEKPKKK